MFVKGSNDLRIILLILTTIAMIPHGRCEDGYDLWLRYRNMDLNLINQYSPYVRNIITSSLFSPMMKTAVSELHRGLSSMLNSDIPTVETLSVGSIVVGTPTISDVIRQLALPLESLGNEGYAIRQTSLNGVTFIVIAGNSEQGALYGSFEFLKLLQTHGNLENVDIISAPKIQLRLLNHWVICFQ